MAVNAHGSTKGTPSPGAINSEMNTGINPKAPKRTRPASEIATLVEEIRATGTWWAHQAGDVQHRYVFCWRWREPDTPVLFCYSVAHWRKLRQKWERALGLIK